MADSKTYKISCYPIYQFIFILNSGEKDGIQTHTVSRDITTRLVVTNSCDIFFIQLINWLVLSHFLLMNKQSLQFPCVARSLQD